MALILHKLGLDQIACYKTESDSITQILKQRCDIDPDIKYSIS